MQAETAMLLDGIGHWYRNGEWLLRNICVQLRRGEVFAVLGPNGRGKTTLINLMLEILTPREGHIRRYGATGFVPQLFAPPFPYSVLDMVLMGRASHLGMWRVPGRRDRAIAHAALRELGLDELAERAVDQLSGGQRQMVMLARALASESEILILDEPAAALDLHNQAAILSLIGRLADQRGLTVVFTTHQPQHALAVADRAMLLMEAEPPLIGTVNEVMHEQSLSRLYGIGLRHVQVAREGGSEESFIPLFGQCRQQQVRRENPHKTAN